MVNCWASSLGGCCGIQSGEHLVSDCVWPKQQKGLTLHGLHWCLHSPKVIGRKSATSNILCKTHNEELGKEVDLEGMKLFDAIRECIRLGTDSETGSSNAFHFDGVLLERWFLKTSINLCIAGASADLKWITSDRVGKNPPDQLVGAAFGRTQLPPPMGLYSAGDVGQQAAMMDKLEFAPISRDGLISGGIFTILGFRYLLFAGIEPPPNRFTLPGTRMENWQVSYLERHPSQLLVNTRNATQTLSYSWA